MLNLSRTLESLSAVEKLKSTILEHKNKL